LGLFTAKDQTWTIAQITNRGREMLRQVASDHSEDWQGLGVSILHELILKELLGMKDAPSPRYVHSVAEFIDAMRKGDIAGRDATGQSGSNAPYELAAIVRPATVEDVRKISLHNERMPAKSTYFFPKLLCGLVFNPLE
jgi:uncharacterized protein (DUF1015 family)